MLNRARLESNLVFPRTSPTARPPSATAPRIVGNETRWGKLGKGLSYRPKAFKNEVETADFKYLADHRLHGRHDYRSALFPGLLGREHQDAQAHAADVFDSGKIQN